MDNNFDETKEFNTENQAQQEESAEVREADEASYNKEADESFKGESAPFERNYNNYVSFGYTPETYMEKKSIRSAASFTGIPFIIMFAIIISWSSIFFIIAGMMGINPLEAYGIISEPAVLQVIQILLSSFIFLVPFTLAAKIKGFRISDLCAFEVPEKKSFLPFFLIGLGFCSFSNIGSSVMASIFSKTGLEYNVDMPDLPKGFFGFMLSLISTAIVPALVEEFACRGIVMGRLLKYGEGFALIVSSLLFSIMHGNFDQIPFAFLVGIILGYVRIKTGSIWTAAAIHSANNLLSVITDYALNGVSILTQNFIFIMYFVICMALAIVGITIVSKKENFSFELEKSQSFCKEAEKYKWYFSSPAIIIMIVVYFLQSMLYFFN